MLKWLFHDHDEKLIPEGFSLGYFFNIATGRELDIMGKYSGVYRKRWWIFKEMDYFYKNRIIKHAFKEKGVNPPIP